MNKTVTTTKRSRAKKYQPTTNALCLTMHSLDGKELRPEALTEAELAVWTVADRYGYVINRALT